MATVASALGLTLSAQFLLGGVVRVFSWPFVQTHVQVQRDYAQAAQLLYPLIPFKDPVEHTTYVGAWFLVTGALLGHYRTRRSVFTLGLALFWNAVLAYGQSMTGLSYWLPLCNAVLVSTMFWLQSQPPRERR